MVKLKTLKDLEHYWKGIENNKIYDPEDKFISERDLREAAREWIESIKAHKLKGNPFDEALNDSLCDWIEHFFNLPENE